jgi:hypothetical protein
MLKFFVLWPLRYLREVACYVVGKLKAFAKWQGRIYILILVPSCKYSCQSVRRNCCDFRVACQHFGIYVLSLHMLKPTTSFFPSFSSLFSLLHSNLIPSLLLLCLYCRVLSFSHPQLFSLYKKKALSVIIGYNSSKHTSPTPSSIKILAYSLGFAHHLCVLDTYRRRSD